MVTENESQDYLLVDFSCFYAREIKQPGSYLQADKSNTQYFTSAVIVYCHVINERLVNCYSYYYSNQLPYLPGGK